MVQKKGTIYNTQNSTDPEILITGFGRLRYSQLRKMVIGKMESTLDFIKHGEYEKAEYVLDPKKELMSLLKALCDVQFEIEDLKKLK